MGVGLYLGDLELVCFTDHEETPVPHYLVTSKMDISDIDPIDRMLQLLSDTIHHGYDFRYVSYKNRITQILIS